MRCTCLIFHQLIHMSHFAQHMSRFVQREYENTNGEMRHVHYRSTLERSQPIVLALLNLNIVTVIIRIINIIKYNTN